jgi:ribonuclease E
LKNDRARIQVGRISHFGLLEMSRQRLRPGLLEGSSRTCPHCEGRGIVRSISSCGLAVLRTIEEHLIARKPENLTVKCGRDVAFYILNEKRDNLLSIETTYGISIFIIPTDDVRGSQAVIERAIDRNIPPRRVQAAPVRMDSAFAQEEEAAEEAVTEEVEAADTAEEESESGSAEGRGEDGPAGSPDREGGRRRRRRRGRRGGRSNGSGERDDHRRSGMESSEAPGLGEQPVIADDAGDEVSEDAAEGGGTDIQDADAGAARSEGGETRDRSSRRDRWGRNRRGRGRDDDRGPQREGQRPRPERTDEADLPADTQVSTPMMQAAPEPVSVAPPTSAGEAMTEPAPRKWQPPAPTVTAEPGERKSGWWSKR